MDHSDFVYIDEHGLLGSNFYWNNRHKADNITEAELTEIGLKDGRVLVHRSIIPVLIEIDAIFQEKGFRLYIKEGYRSKALYEFIYRKRVEKYGQERTDKLINMRDMPHATGLTVDVGLRDAATGEEVMLRDRADGDDAYFINFYRHKSDDWSRRYQELQDFVIHTMIERGFRLGKKREYFHFDYKPETPPNYDASL